MPEPTILELVSWLIITIGTGLSFLSSYSWHKARKIANLMAERAIDIANREWQASAREAALEQCRIWQWRSCEDEMPEPGVKVVVSYVNQNGMSRCVMALHCGKFEIEVPNPEDGAGFFDHDEEGDVYYLQEGWYEFVDNLDDNALVPVTEGKVTYWQDLPPSPRQMGMQQ